MMRYLMAFLCIATSLEILWVWRSALRGRLAQSVLEHADPHLILLTAPRTLKPLRGFSAVLLLAFVLVLAVGSTVLVVQPADSSWGRFEQFLLLVFAGTMVAGWINWVLYPLHFVITPEDFSSFSFYDSVFARNNIRLPWNRVRSFSCYTASPDMLILVFETEEKRPIKIKTGGLAPEHRAVMEAFAGRAIAAAEPQPLKEGSEPCNM